MASEAELLPCPFCGCGAEADNWATWYVRCTGCDARQIGLTRAKAVADWNTRATPPVQGEAIIRELQCIRMGMTDPYAAQDIISRLVVKAQAVALGTAPPPVGEGVREAYDRCAQNARNYARCYSEGSDGRNTFIMFAEWAEGNAAAAALTANPAGGEG